MIIYDKYIFVFGITCKANNVTVDSGKTGCQVECHLLEWALCTAVHDVFPVKSKVIQAEQW